VSRPRNIFSTKNLGDCYTACGGISPLCVCDLDLLAERLFL
jgi:hypothetical protein